MSGEGQRREPTAATRSAVEEAWAAGVLDSKGYLHERQVFTPESRGRFTYDLSLTDTNLALLARFQEIAGVGRIRDKVTQKGGPIYRWNLFRRADIEALLDRFSDVLLPGTDERLRPRGVPTGQREPLTTEGKS